MIDSNNNKCFISKSKLINCIVESGATGEIGSESEAEWVKRERELFKSEYDQNKDGLLDRKELLRLWKGPEGQDAHESEVCSSHLSRFGLSLIM